MGLEVGFSTLSFLLCTCSCVLSLPHRHLEFLLAHVGMLLLGLSAISDAAGVSSHDALPSLKLPSLIASSTVLLATAASPFTHAAASSQLGCGAAPMLAAGV
jgi:hypothetical protein